MSSLFNWPDCVVRWSADDKIVLILKTCNAALVAVQRPHELAGRRVPHFDGAVAGSGNDVLLVEVNNVDGSAMSDLTKNKYLENRNIMKKFRIRWIDVKFF